MSNPAMISETFLVRAGGEHGVGRQGDTMEVPLGMQELQQARRERGHHEQRRRGNLRPKLRGYHEAEQSCSGDECELEPFQILRIVALRPDEKTARPIEYYWDGQPQIH